MQIYSAQNCDFFALFVTFLWILDCWTIYTYHRHVLPENFGLILPADCGQRNTNLKARLSPRPVQTGFSFFFLNVIMYFRFRCSDSIFHSPLYSKNRNNDPNSKLNKYVFVIWTRTNVRLSLLCINSGLWLQLIHDNFFKYKLRKTCKLNCLCIFLENA